MTFSQSNLQNQFMPQNNQQQPYNPFPSQQDNGFRRFGHRNNQNNQITDDDPNNNILTRFGLSALSNMFHLGVPSSLLGKQNGSQYGEQYGSNGLMGGLGNVFGSDNYNMY